MKVISGKEEVVSEDEAISDDPISDDEVEPATLRRPSSPASQAGAAAVRAGRSASDDRREVMYDAGAADENALGGDGAVSSQKYVGCLWLYLSNEVLFIWTSIVVFTKKFSCCCAANGRNN